MYPLSDHSCPPASLVDTLVVPVRRLWPGVREASKRFRDETVPSISSTVKKMSNEVVQIVRDTVIPSIEESLLELSNDAVPVINRGIDIASEGLERSSNVISRATAKGMNNIGIRMLGRRRHHRLSRIVNNISHRFNDTVSRFTNALANMVGPHEEVVSTNTRRDFPDYDYYNNNYYNYYYDDYGNILDPTIYYHYGNNAKLLEKSGHHSDNDQNTNNNKGMASLVRNTAYVLSSRLLGRNLTEVVAPIARSVSKSVGESLPAVSVSDGRIVIDLPGASTGRQENLRVCTTPTKENGLCKDLADCPDLILDLTNLRRSVCFKSLFVPGVCCPKSSVR